MASLETTTETINDPANEGAIEPSAMADAASHARLWLVTIIGLAADLWSKAWAFSSLRPGESRELLKNVANFKLSLNPGALFGIGQGLAPIFVGASVLALMFVLYLFANSSPRRWSMHIALGLVLAGAIGNLYDRTTQAAYVVYGAGGGRAIGTLVNETESTVTVGDFPNGANPQVFTKPLGPRSGMQPVVRDFIEIQLRVAGYSIWPWIFNIADALLVVGVGMLLINFWFDRQPPVEPAPQAV